MEEGEEKEEMEEEEEEEEDDDDTDMKSCCGLRFSFGERKRGIYSSEKVRGHDNTHYKRTGLAEAVVATTLVVYGHRLINI